MPERHPITMQRVLFPPPPEAAITVRRDLAYGDGLSFDLYAPARAEGPTPAVIFVVGYSDPGAGAVLGCTAREMAAFVDWARLVAASGMTAIAYANGGRPLDDLRTLLAHVEQHADALGIDASRIGLWACSGHVPTALAVVTRSAEAGALQDAASARSANALAERIRCAALLYGYTMDLDGSTAVADASRTFGFANASSGKSIDDLPDDVPLFVARAGADAMPGLNAALDRFTAALAGRNRPFVLATHPRGPHAFDLFDDGAMTKAMVRQTLAFLGAQLLP